MAHNPGGVPLAYLAKNLLVNGTGQPLYMAHAFSIVCAIGGLASLIWLARLLGTAGGWRQAAILYAVVPISLRYAVEARQYGPALALSIGATGLLAWLDERPGWGKRRYTHWFSGWDCIRNRISRLWRRRIWFGRGGAGVSALAWWASQWLAVLFLPWYLYARGFWAQAVTEAGYQSSINWKTPLMMMRELSGGGYLLTAVLVILAVRGYLRTGMPHSSKRLLLLWMVVPIPLVLAADSLFHYFFAIRQIAAHRAAAVSAGGRGAASIADGLETHSSCRAHSGGVGLRCALVRPREGKLGLPAAEARRLLAPGRCVEAVPRSAADLYRFYEPLLPFCSDGDGGRHR